MSKIIKGPWKSKDMKLDEHEFEPKVPVWVIHTLILLIVTVIAAWLL